MRCWPASRREKSSVSFAHDEKSLGSIPSDKGSGGTTGAAVIVFSYGGRNYTFRRPKTHQDALDLVHLHIVPYDATATEIRFLARIPTLLQDGDVEITSDSWVDSLPLVTRVQVALFDKAQVAQAAQPPPLAPEASPSYPALPVVTPSPDRNPFRMRLYASGGGTPASEPGPALSKSAPFMEGAISLWIRTRGDLFKLEGVYRSQTVWALKENIGDVKIIPACEQELTYLGVQMENGKTLEDYGVQHNATISLSEPYRMQRRARKPVIYLFPPAPMDVVVRLSLTSQWSFSALYPSPLPEGKSPDSLSSQTVEWNVHARRDSTLTDKTTGIDVAYLFWEAEPHTYPNSPPASRPGTPQELEVEGRVEDFIPGLTRCSPADSVLLEAGQVAPYLDRALVELGLHTEARTSFITYWLPDILKHTFIVLRFVPQASYEQAAPLDISPKPDVVTRVFMLFQGVPPEECDLWEVAAKLAKEPVSRWKTIVGVEPGEIGEGVFRVLEWGGMELK